MVPSGKALGGERVVAKTPMVYRAWCAISKTVAIGWEQPLPDWDVCKPGSCALQVALQQGFRAERAALSGQAVSAGHW